jgi:hypothetical protein
MIYFNTSSYLTSKAVSSFHGTNSSISNTCSWIFQQYRFATKKAGGSVKNGRDSIGKRLGLKKSGGEKVYPGHIIIRQRGLSYKNGSNTG